MERLSASENPGNVARRPQSEEEKGKRRCWTCEQWLDPNLINRCTACNLAVYCGKACQRVDWKQGSHKEKCPRVQRVYQAFNKGFLKQVKQAAKHPERHLELTSGVPQNLTADYMLGERIAHHAYYFNEFSDSSYTMENYYENIGKIAKGELRWATQHEDSARPGEAATMREKISYMQVNGKLFSKLDNEEKINEAAMYLERCCSEVLGPLRFLQMYRDTSDVDNPLETCKSSVYEMVRKFV